ncbi:hypothetical protein [Thorsellia kenyensis]|uniref:Uncharacterized protein n=1 Tax=Thorsellia kenyensis TaxID=1549888 RepID=A0ABV6CBC7_9GAMM
MNKAINLSFYECRSPDEFRAKHNEICKKNGWTPLDTVHFGDLILGIYAEQNIEPAVLIEIVEGGYLVNKKYLVTNHFIEAWQVSDPCCAIDRAYIHKYSPFNDLDFAETERIMRQVLFERTLINDMETD